MKKDNIFLSNSTIPSFQIKHQHQEQQNNQLDKQITKIAQKIGDSCLDIYQDIKLFKQASGDISEYQFPLFKYQKVITQSNVCAKILTKNIQAFKCHDCIYQSNSIMCVECFQQSDHQGHIYQLIKVFGGSCDCGDEQKWSPQGSCRKHNDPNLVQQMKKKINQKQQKQFIQQLSFCFSYFFFMYNQAQLFLKRIKDENNQQYRKKLSQAQKFCSVLVQYLVKFNNNSLISNLMTYNMFSTRLTILSETKVIFFFCKNLKNLTIFQAILKCIKLQKSCDHIVNLFTQLFTIREFKRQLTIIFSKFCYQDPRFSMSNFNHLSCQLLTSHKMIKELVQNRQIKPFIYKPKTKDFKSFENLAQNFVRYYIDIEYLSKLYKESSQIYLTYHITQGQLPSLAYYRNASYDFDQTINYYGIQQIFLNKYSKILIVILNSKNCLTTLQKGIQDLFKQCNNIYYKQYDQFFNLPMNDQLSAKYIYLSHQLALSLTIFGYFQKLDQQKLTQKQKIIKLINVLKFSKQKQFKDKILGILKIIHSYINNFIILLDINSKNKQQIHNQQNFLLFFKLQI